MTGDARPSISSAEQIGCIQDVMASDALRKTEQGFNHWMRAGELRDGIQDVTDIERQTIAVCGEFAFCAPAFSKFVGNSARWALAAWHTSRARRLLPRP